MSNAYTIEYRKKTVGIIVSDGAGYRFFASARAFYALEGRYFADYAAALKALRTV